jgi:hypothetical protein
LVLLNRTLDSTWTARLYATMSAPATTMSALAIIAMMMCAAQLASAPPPQQPRRQVSHLLSFSPFLQIKTDGGGGLCV